MDEDVVELGTDPGGLQLTDDWHIGRSWSGHPLEDECPCPKQPCGLVSASEYVSACPEHGFRAMKTIRQAHHISKCPGKES